MRVGVCACGCLRAVGCLRVWLCCACVYVCWCVCVCKPQMISDIRKSVAFTMRHEPPTHICTVVLNVLTQSILFILRLNAIAIASLQCRLRVRQCRLNVIPMSCQCQRAFRCHVNAAANHHDIHRATCAPEELRL